VTHQIARWATVIGLIAATQAVIPAAAQPLPGTTCSLFPTDNILNTDISNLPVNSMSATWMSNMAQNANLHPDLGTFAQGYGIPINVAPPPTGGVTPTFTYNAESDHPAEGYPIDQSTAIEGGPTAPSTSDRHALVVNKNLCKLYEIFNLQNFTNGQIPQAGSGAVWALNSNAMRPAGWTSSDAAGLPVAPLLLRPDEILAGSVPHAIRFTAHCTSTYIWPASHQAGSCTNTFPPMGARFRLRSGFNVSGFSANTQTVLRAFQHYGLILADNGSDWFFGGSTDDWWGTAAGNAVINELKTIPAAQFDAIDESALQSAANSYQAKSAAALPQDRLHFGLSNSPADLSWMTGSNVPWRYRYQYLAGGVNTPAGSGWQDWNSPTGAFATYYMDASSKNGYIPTFTYYELLQSNPSTGANESDRDFSNLNNTGTMASYYANFKLLMTLAGKYSKPVVVHVEPDLWGYLQQRANGGDASTLTASVASSGFAEAAGFPNTAQGFAWELIHLRDLYAPNAALAIHASGWSSGIDIDSNTSPSINVTAEADKTAAFMNSAGITANTYASTWDLVFNDVDDHDAAWWEAQGRVNAGFTHWWDPTNTTFPNFTRYLAWVAELKLKTNRPQVVWQVPVGNQYFLTMNNTCGHYQDNVAPYFISHASDLYTAGLIAVMFGAGNSCQTSNTDAMKDGVTNNGGVPTTDTLGRCNACNTQSSTWADDDGGYLRIFVGQYYGATNNCAVLGGLPLIADYNGDGKADLGFLHSAGVCVLLSNGTQFTQPTWPPSGPFYGSKATLTGDVNGDGKADVVAVNASQTFVMTSTGSGFTAPTVWANQPFYGTRGTFLADLNGDGKADLVAVNDSSVWVMLSTGTSFGPPTLWSTTPFYGNVTTLIGNITGTGKASLIAVNYDGAWVMTSTGTSFGAPTLWSNKAFYGNKATLVGDFNGDGKADLIAVNDSGSWVMTSTGSGFNPPASASSTPFYGSTATTIGDVNGDKRADLVAVNGLSVWVSTSTGTAFAAPAVWS
jgi:hypothetical protein